MTVSVVDVVIGGLLTGGIYALIAAGLSMQYGVARILNISHGEFIMLGAFITWSLTRFAGLDPLLSIAAVGPLVFVVGYVLHRTVYAMLWRKSESALVYEGNSLLISFGILFIIQNFALLVWGSEIRGLSYMAFPIEFLGGKFAANRIVALGFAVVIGVIFYLFLSRTRMGKAIRASAQDQVTAGLMGVNINTVLAICFGLGAVLAGLAGVLVSVSYSISATMGMEYTTIALIVVVLGGLGSIPGSFIGGILLGLIGSVVSFWQPGLSMVAYYILFMLLLLVRPSGILGR